MLELLIVTLETLTASTVTTLNKCDQYNISIINSGLIITAPAEVICINKIRTFKVQVVNIFQA